LRFNDARISSFQPQARQLCESTLFSINTAFLFLQSNPQTANVEGLLRRRKKVFNFNSYT
jgi:hypothetical protein